jgi:hypothetical protein
MIILCYRDAFSLELETEFLNIIYREFYALKGKTIDHREQ